VGGWLKRKGVTAAEDSGGGLLGARDDAKREQESSLEEGQCRRPEV
jgi:hypothetical protein